MRNTTLSIFIFFSVSLSFAQNTQQIDSLEKLINTTRIDSVKAKAMVQLAFLYHSSDPQKTIQLANDALKLGVALNMKKVQAASYLSISYSKYFSGDYPSAAESAVKSIELYLNASDKKGEAFAYGQLGNVYNRQKNFKKAIECYLHSIKLKEELGDKNSIAAALNNIGNVYGQLEQDIEAEKIFRRSLAIEIENGNTKGVAESYQSIANVIFPKDFIAGEKLFRKAIFIFDSIKEKSAEINCIISLACAYGIHGDNKEAIDYANKALNFIGSSNSLYEKEKIYGVLKEAYFELGKHKEAHEFSEKWASLKDSIYSSELAGQTEEISAKYETEKKEKEIIILEKNNAEINLLAQERKTVIILIGSGLVVLFVLILLLFLRNKSIKQQQTAEFAKNKAELEQKALRAQMNPHFLFNSLNSIQRLFVEGKADLANEFMADFGNLLRRILNNSGKNKISLKEELDTLKLYLDIEKMRCDGCFDYKIDIDETIDQLNTNVPPLVIQPFAENAIWHGVLPKKTKGQINIGIKRNLQDNSLLCLVEDNGMGFDKTKINTHESKGIQITELRLGTNVEFETSQNGTKVKIIIPLTA